jgi:integrase
MEFLIAKNKTEERYLYQFKNFLDSDLEIEDYLKKSDKKEISRLKNSLRLINLDESEKKEINILCDKYTKIRPKFRKEPEPTLNLKTLENTVNKLKSKRLKLGYRLQEISGLRVSEIADLEERDIKINANNELLIHVRHGKGNKERYVKCFRDDWVLKEILKLKPKKNNKLFCAAKYIIENANKCNFHTHDLRKVFANIFYYNCTENKRTTIRLLKEQLGHEKRNRTYLKYINRNINFYKSKFNKLN